MLLWPTIQEQQHHANNVHHNLSTTTCPTAKTGVLGGGAFLALDASLFWLVCFMLVSNLRDDFLEDLHDGSKARLSTTSGNNAVLEKGVLHDSSYDYVDAVE